MLSFLLMFALIVGIVFWGISIYNRLVKSRNQVKEGWSGIDVQLKRRHNLIPNLVSTVEGYAEHEKDVFEEVTALRTKIRETHSVEQKGMLEGQLSRGLMNIFAVAEQYPDLKANTNFIQLQEQLAEIEDQIQLARRYYNGTTRDYNTLIESFPQLIIAALFQFHPYWSCPYKTGPLSSPQLSS